jgi:hypothetical protein
MTACFHQVGSLPVMGACACSTHGKQQSAIALSSHRARAMMPAGRVI